MTAAAEPRESPPRWQAKCSLVCCTGRRERLFTEGRAGVHERLRRSVVSTDSAAALIIAAGGNPDRLRSDAAFSSSSGVAPVQAPSGKTIRHRAHRGGNRDANAALHRIVLVRIRWDEPTRACVERRAKQGRTKREIMRWLMRHLAREVLWRAQRDELWVEHSSAIEPRHLTRIGGPATGITRASSSLFDGLPEAVSHREALRRGSPLAHHGHCDQVPQPTL